MKKLKFKFNLGINVNGLVYSILFIIITTTNINLIAYAKQVKNNNNNNVNNIEYYKLSNGLQVVLIQNNLVPAIFHGLWYKTGSADSPSDKTGLAHFLEHLMFKGTPKYPNGSFKTIINHLGGRQNALTSSDFTLYYVAIAKEYLETVMDLESDRMVNAMFTQEDLEKELQVVLQERRQTIESIPENLLFEALFPAVFWEHPYGKPVIGFKHHIESYNLEDVKTFYNNWYAPNNAILVIAGDLSKDTIVSLIERYYGNVPTKKIPNRTLLRRSEPSHNKVLNKLEIRDTKLNNPFWMACYEAPNHRTGGVQIKAAIDLLQTILGDPSLGRLNKLLVNNRKLAFTASAGFMSSYELDPLPFLVHVTPVNVIDLNATEESVNAEIANLLFNGINNSEFITAKQQSVFSFRLSHDSMSSIATLFGNCLATEYSFEQVKNMLQTLQNVTLEEVNKAAKLIFEKQPIAISYAYPIIEN